MIGTVYNGEYDRVIGPSGLEDSYDVESVRQSETATVLVAGSAPDGVAVALKATGSPIRPLAVAVAVCTPAVVPRVQVAVA